MAATGIRAPVWRARRAGPAPARGAPSGRAPRTPAALGAGAGRGRGSTRCSPAARSASPEESRLQIGVARDRLRTRSRRCSSAAACAWPPARWPCWAWRLLAGFARVVGAVDRPGRWRPTRAGSSSTARSPTRWWRRSALVLGSSLPRAAERVALGYLVVATAARALRPRRQALPLARDPGPDRPQPHRATSRACARRSSTGTRSGSSACSAVPIAVRAAADLGGLGAPARIAALVALVLLLTTLLLTYSRGGLARARGGGSVALIDPEHRSPAPGGGDRGRACSERCRRSWWASCATTSPRDGLSRLGPHRRRPAAGRWRSSAGSPSPRAGAGSSLRRGERLALSPAGTRAPAPRGAGRGW